MPKETSDKNRSNQPDTKGELTVSQVEPAYSRDKLYTVDDWLSWDEDFRSELHDGMLVALAQPVVKHQSILGEIFAQLHNFLKGKPCKVFPAPFGVNLNKNEQTVFEPDIVVVCDMAKLEGGKICVGAPDMVVEILSPSTSHHDRVYKFDKYRKAGVREYWIVDPDIDAVQVNILHDGLYITHMYDKDATVKLTALKGCKITLPDVFSPPTFPAN